MTSELEDLTGGPQVWPATALLPSAPVSWLARGRIPRAAVSLLVGDEGIGKSLFWVWLSAAITTGRELPEFGVPSREPGTVLLVLTEDEWATTVRPRLEVAGADLRMVSVICTEDDGSGSPVFPRDLHLVAEAQADLVIVDAFLDTVPAGAKIAEPHQARLALHPWKEVATTTGSAVLLLTHTNRMDSKNPRDRYGITSELRKKARATLFAQEDEEGRLNIGPEKSNLSRLLPASIFSIEAVQVFTPTDDSDGTVPRLAYVGESEKTSRQQLVANYEAAHDDDQGNDRSEAEAWLEDYLTANPGVESKDAKKAARKALGCTERTLQRAAKAMGVVAESHGFPRVTVWSLPDSGDIAGPHMSESVATVVTESDKGKHMSPLSPRPIRERPRCPRSWPIFEGVPHESPAWFDLSPCRATAGPAGAPRRNLPRRLDDAVQQLVVVDQ